MSLLHTSVCLIAAGPSDAPKISCKSHGVPIRRKKRRRPSAPCRWLRDLLRPRMAAERDLLVDPFAGIAAEELAHGLLGGAHEYIVDRAWIDAVDADPSRGNLSGHAPHQAHQRMFG